MKYYFLGTDEAGYGPNLGPLSVSSSLWAGDFPRTNDPLTLLNSRVLKSVSFQNGFHICDSKRLYHSGHLAPLERSFFFAFEYGVNEEQDLPLFQGRGTLSPHYSSWLSVVHALSTAPRLESEFSPPWEKEISFSLPLTGARDWLETFSTDYFETKNRLETEGVSLLGIASRLVQPLEFNLMIDRLGLKSELLAEVTFETALYLLRPILSKTSEKKEIIVCCDKLGGRNRYGDLLRRFLPEWGFKVDIESRQKSVYRYSLPHGAMTFIFQAKGESNIPTALSSIVSKYQREISMEAFNRYWLKRLSNLAPTAGYPVDARRFRNDVDEVRRKEGISDDCFWRKK